MPMRSVHCTCAYPREALWHSAHRTGRAHPNMRHATSCDKALRHFWHHVNVVMYAISLEI